MIISSLLRVYMRVALLSNHEMAWNSEFRVRGGSSEVDPCMMLLAAKLLFPKG